MSRKHKYQEEDAKPGEVLELPPETKAEPPQASLELDAPDPRDAEIAALKAQLEQLARDRADADAFRKLKAKEAEDARRAETLKTYRCTVRKLALRPRVIRVGPNEVPLGVQEVDAYSPEDAKEKFKAKVVGLIRSNGVGDKERLAAQFLSSADAADWTIEELSPPELPKVETKIITDLAG